MGTELQDYRCANQNCNKLLFRYKGELPEEAAIEIKCNRCKLVQQYPINGNIKEIKEVTYESPKIMPEDESVRII